MERKHHIDEAGGAWIQCGARAKYADLATTLEVLDTLRPLSQDAPAKHKAG